MPYSIYFFNSEELDKRTALQLLREDDKLPLEDYLISESLWKSILQSLGEMGMAFEMKKYDSWVRLDFEKFELRFLPYRIEIEIPYSSHFADLEGSYDFKKIIAILFEHGMCLFEPQSGRLMREEQEVYSSFLHHKRMVDWVFGDDMLLKKWGWALLMGLGLLTLIALLFLF